MEYGYGVLTMGSVMMNSYALKFTTVLVTVSPILANFPIAMELQCKSSGGGQSPLPWRILQDCPHLIMFSSSAPVGKAASML